MVLRRRARTCLLVLRSPWSWLVQRRAHAREAKALVDADARALIEAHGIQAYGVARWRAYQIQQGHVIDDSRPEGHWHAVKRRVGTLVGYEIGIDNATRRFMDP